MWQNAADVRIALSITVILRSNTRVERMSGKWHANIHTTGNLENIHIHPMLLSSLCNLFKYSSDYESNISLNVFILNMK